MKLVTVNQMREIEKEADSTGLSYAQMMANAGRGLAQVILDLNGNIEPRVILGLVGPGNNGGDTLVALSILAKAGWQAQAYLIKRKKDSLVEQFKNAGGGVFAAGEDHGFEKLASSIEDSAIVLDGVLGTGIRLPLKPEIGNVLAAAKVILGKIHTAPLIIAVDCPSGVDCASGEAAAETLSANITVTMAVAKQGMLKLPAFEKVGELVVVDIGLRPELKGFRFVKTEAADRNIVKAILPARPLDAHKGTFGTLLIAAGSTNYTGAALLAGKAAYRSGVGLVTLAVPAPVYNAIAGQIPEATWVLLPNEQGVIARDAAEVLVKNLGRATAMLVGPGFGTEDTTREFMENIFTGKMVGKKGSARIGFVREEGRDKSDPEKIIPPVVFDADGLKLLAKIKDWQTLLPAPAILTPHPGEMAVLTGLTKDEIQADRETIAEKYSKEWGHVIVLKGAFTVVAAPDGRLTVVPVATPALARAGTGDVLAGLIAGLLAQGVEAYNAARAGAWIHGQAGLFAAEEVGSTAAVIAGDVLDSIPDVLYDLVQTSRDRK